MMFDILYVSENHPLAGQIISLYNYQSGNLLGQLNPFCFPIDAHLRLAWHDWYDPTQFFLLLDHLCLTFLPVAVAEWTAFFGYLRGMSSERSSLPLWMGWGALKTIMLGESCGGPWRCWVKYSDGFIFLIFNFFLLFCSGMLHLSIPRSTRTSRNHLKVWLCRRRYLPDEPPQNLKSITGWWGLSKNWSFCSRFRTTYWIIYTYQAESVGLTLNISWTFAQLGVWGQR